MSGGVIGMVLVHGGVNGTVLVHAQRGGDHPTPPAPHVGTGVSTRGSLDIKAAKNLFGWGTSKCRDRPPPSVDHEVLRPPLQRVHDPFIARLGMD
jgi:hypothetical protein